MDTELTKHAAGLILLAGAAVMAANVVRYHRLLHRYEHLQECASGSLNRIFTIHRVLMVFFLIGYLGVFGATFSSISFVSETLVAVIFLCGAIFVMLGIDVQGRMLAEARQNYFRAIRMMVRAVEIRDPYTMGHSEHVANLCMLVHARLPPALQKEIDPELLHSTALMHDIGKIGVPERVLNKPGRPSDDEWAQIRRHTTIGKDLLSKMSVCSSVPDWVAYHHERMDGAGYHGLPGDRIPLAARLLAVADTFSAIVTDRPYRRGRPYPDAVDILKANAGTQLDTDLVRVFCDIPQPLVDACRPQALVLDFLQEIERLEQRVLQGEAACDSHTLLSAEVGERWLTQMVRFCRKQGEPLCLAALSLEGLDEMELVDGYHAVDECVAQIGALLIDNTRNTDVVVHSRRGVFLLVLPDCAIEHAENLLDRIIGEVSSRLEQSCFTRRPVLSRRMASCHPERGDDWNGITAFLDEHFATGTIPFHAGRPRLSA